MALSLRRRAAPSGAAAAAAAAARVARAGSVEDVAALDYRHWLGRRTLASRLLATPRGVRRIWGRSLQLRVAVTTLVVTGVFVLVVGVYLENRIASGVLSTKQSAARAQAENGLKVAALNLAGVGNDAAGTVNALTPYFPAPTTAPTAETDSDTTFYTSIISAQLQSFLPLGQPKVPKELSAAVRQGAEAIQYAQVAPPGRNSKRVPTLIVGQQLVTTAASFEVYYFFPLTAEQQTISLVQTTVLLAGIGLVLLIVLIAVLVTRQAVGPVRAVSQTARRLAEGDLTQRVAVQGTDELAVLGGSFNDMASSLQRQFRRLEELSRLQRRFTSDVSHELRTPLTTVRMAAEIIHARRGEFTPDLARSSELMYAELDRFEALLGDLLEISRYDAGVARLELETVDLHTVIDAAVAGTAHLAQRKGCQVLVHVRPAPVMAEVDPRRIERIVRNLLGNAIDHSEGLPVSVRVDTDGVGATISVRDHGVGLRPGEAGLVFNRFWRGDPSRSRLTGGTGLGLSISMEDARLHGGWLQAWGERGRGALFRLSVPLRPTQPLPSRPVALMPDPAADEADHIAARGGSPADDASTRPGGGGHGATRAEPTRDAVPDGASAAGGVASHEVRSNAAAGTTS